MKALTLTNKTLSNQSGLPTPELAEGEALIKVSLAGICSTDLEMVRGYAGFSGVLGHEFVGVVEAVADETDNEWVSRRVVGSINIGCGVCDVCLNDGPEHCPARRVLGIRDKNGAFAEYLTLPVRNLFAVPGNVPNESAVFTEPLAAAYRVIEQIKPLAISKAAVVGPGRLGLLIAKLLSLAGYETLVLGRSAQSLALPERWRLNTGLVDEIESNSFDCVIDATGHSSGFAQALRLVKFRGALVLKSTFAASEPIDLSKVVVAEIKVIGSRCGPFAKALSLLEEQVIPVESMIDGRYTLSEGIEAFAHAERAGVRKILLKP